MNDNFVTVLAHVPCPNLGYLLSAEIGLQVRLCGEQRLAVIGVVSKDYLVEESLLVLEGSMAFVELVLIADD